MKKLLEIEEKINVILTWLFSAIWTFIVKSTPQILKDKYHYYKNKIISFITKTKNRILGFISSIKDKGQGSVKFVKVESREAVKLILKKVEIVKNLRIKDLYPEVWLYPLLKSSKEKGLSLKNKLVTKIQGFGVRNIVIMSSVAVVGLGILSQFYLQSRTMLINSGVMRDPASVSNRISYPDLRPKYYKRDERHLLIKNIRFPVYVGGSSKSRAVTVDLNVITSNKYLRAYLDENHYLVNDVFNTRIEPIIPSFPLEAEGKIILKEKVMKELNKLIKELKINGHVEEVQIHAITSG